jgi:bifunctional enzyme CysN/CysC
MAQPAAVLLHEASIIEEVRTSPAGGVEPLPAEQRPLLRFSTAGSVDDGKSTLIGRLLHDTKSLYEDHIESVRKASEREGKKGSLSFALLTDGLKAEREQGITIDVAYRYFSTPRRHFIMADSPGHEQYTRNMATGASTADVTVILIDARKGVLVQTRRHAFIASLLGVSSFIVAVNKMDLVNFSEEVFNQIQADFSELSNKLGIKQVHYIPVAALHGDNIVTRGERMEWYQGPSLLECLENLDVARSDPTRDFRFPVQLVLRDSADYRGYAGKIVSGAISVGDEVMVLPSMRSSIVSRIEVFDSTVGVLGVDIAYAPMSVVVSLRDQVDISRGSMMVRSGAMPQVKSSFDAMMVWMSEIPLQRNKRYLLMHTTQQTQAYVEAIQYRVDMHSLNREPADALGLNDVGRVSITSPKPIFLDTYRGNRDTGSFILIDPETNATLAGGMIVDRNDHEFLPELSSRGGEIARAPASVHIHREDGVIDRAGREQHLGFKAGTIWFTGLSGAGKSALAKALERRLLADGRMCYRLDGDNLRFGLNRDLGFSEGDRIENIRRVAEVAQLFNDAGITTLCSFISPFARDREHARKIIGAEHFIEVYVSTAIEVCEARDPHGLYARARKGEIGEFTGISSPYEAPKTPDLSIDTGIMSLEESVELIYQAISERLPQSREA